MRRLFPLVLLSLTLAGCGSKTMRFSLTFDVEDSMQRTVLLEESKKVIERRLSRFEDATPSPMVVENAQSGSVLLSFDVNNAEARTTLTSELLTPYSLRVMIASTGTGDLFIEEQGWFKDTDITQKDIFWTEGAADSEGKGIVRLVFSDEGRAKFAAVFHAHPGGTMGLFVHDRLMAKMPIDAAEPKEEIVIAGIPVPDMAGIFADDVNVGTHVTFSLP
ncbi:MAG: hypothetical protein PHO20_02845 [Candidatus Peribacteraceae bacterium]|nr:hypothetical protein [Candidatus Peribacteraceae bacterium]MDD5739679.1 hypothetical protein [Candidatus Peribacteraceae bacterium]